MHCAITPNIVLSQQADFNSLISQILMINILPVFILCSLWELSLSERVQYAYFCVTWTLAHG